MSLEKFWGNSKSSEKKEKTPFSYSRHPIIKKKKSKYLLTTSSPFRPSYTPSPENDKYKEEWLQFLNGYTDNRKPVISSLFSGYSFYFDGYLGEKTRLELVEMVMTHGGDVEHFYYSSRVSLIIARNVCFSKEQQYLKKPSIRVIYPTWIIDSVKMNKLQPFSKYIVIKEKTNPIDHYFH